MLGNQENHGELRDIIFKGHPYNSNLTAKEIFPTIFIELMKSKERFWNYYPQIGICYFRKHLLINIEILCSFLSESSETMLTKLNYDCFNEDQIPDYLAEVLNKQFNGNLEGWKLYKITPSDHNNLFSLMQNVQTPFIEEFDKNRAKPSFELSNIENSFSIEPTSNVTDDYGKYYISLVPSENSSTTPKCWLFSTISDTEMNL